MFKSVEQANSAESSICKRNECYDVLFVSYYDMYLDTYINIVTIYNDNK